MKNLLIVLIASIPSVVVSELRPLNTDELESVSGAGVALVLRDISVDAGQKSSGSGQIQTRFSDYSALTVSELKIAKAGTSSEPINIGSTSQPISLNLLPVDTGLENRDELQINWSDISDSADIHLRLDYQATNGFFEGTPTSEKFLSELDLKGTDIRDTRLSFWGDEEKGLALAFNTSLYVDNFEIAGQPDLSANASLKGFSLKNLQFGNTYQPLTLSTTEDPSRSYDIAKGIAVEGNVDETHADEYNAIVARLEAQEFAISEVQYIETVDGPILTANIPRIELEVSPLTEQTAPLRYAPYQGENGAQAFRGSLTDIDIESISFGNGVNITPLAPETVNLTRTDGTVLDSSWNYGSNVVEVRGFDIQHLRFTPRDIVQ